MECEKGGCSEGVECEKGGCSEGVECEKGGHSEGDEEFVKFTTSHVTVYLVSQKYNDFLPRV